MSDPLFADVRREWDIYAQFGPNDTLGKFAADGLAVLAQLDQSVDALQVASDLLVGEGYDNDPDYTQEWQTIRDALEAANSQPEPDA